MTNNNDDNNWIKVLETGQIDPDNEETSKKVLILRKIILEKLASKEQFQTSNMTFNRTLDEARRSNLLFSEKQSSVNSSKWKISWAMLIASIASAFSFGMLISRVNFLPEMVINGITQDKYEANFGGTKSINLFDKSPNELSEKIIKTVIDSGLEIFVSKAEETYTLKFKNIKSNDKQMLELFKILNINPDFHGAITININVAASK
jgi:hypothetical protein